MSKSRKPYRIIGAYDSETTNLDKGGNKIAFPIIHQLGFIDGMPLDEITPENVENAVKIELFRHSLDLYGKLNSIMEKHLDYVPVILCHNLAFDMYGLSPWLSRHNVRVLAKSARKPITFTIMDESGNPALVIWDTLIFTQQSLERMGTDCGYGKGVGEWDYDLIRTPETPLTDEELDYAKRDIYTLVTWFAWWIRRNPDIGQDRLGLNVVTKTGIVRERRRVRFDQLKGIGQKQNIGRYWLYRNRSEAPKSDDELFTMLACTRGGLTFCSSVNASVPFDTVNTDETVVGYDAVSQHPAQLVSHRYPVRFREMPPHVLELAFEVVGLVTLDRLLERWDKPFPVAFNACFEFTNLRPKPGSVFERFGIMPIASARYKSGDTFVNEDNGDKPAYDVYLEQHDYIDRCENAVSAFGKLISADKARLYITELAAWEIWQCYTWDSVKALHGYETGRFMRPSDMDVVSTMQFYKAKNEYKRARGEFYETGTITNGDKLEALGVAPAIVSSMKDGSISAGDVEATYLSLKADLNAIFGISASNEYRRATVLGSNGIEYEGKFGICNAPGNPKVWYQFGQRIVGWSRVAQICTMMLCAPYIETIINGDTDSLKMLVKESKRAQVDKALERLGQGIDRAKVDICSRVRYAYPNLYDELKLIGHYECEFAVDRFCASWNKAYCMHDTGKDGKRRFSFTLAGIPTRRRESKYSSFIGLNGYADRLYGLGWSYADICNLFLGYNTTFAHDVIKLNARKFPEWNTCTFDTVEDYQGRSCNVVEPHALALYPMSKTVNDTSSPDNRDNMRYAVKNNPNVNVSPKVVYSKGVLDMEGINYDEIL